MQFRVHVHMHMADMARNVHEVIHEVTLFEVITVAYLVLTRNSDCT